jgi:hypothetical protein
VRPVSDDGTEDRDREHDAYCQAEPASASPLPRALLALCALARGAAAGHVRRPYGPKREVVMNRAGG